MKSISEDSFRGVPPPTWAKDPSATVQDENNVGLRSEVAGFDEVSVLSFRLP